MRELKHHEKRLLRKVDLLQWKDRHLREAQVVRRYMLQRREDYAKYSRMVGQVRNRDGRLHGNIRVWVLCGLQGMC